MKFPKEILAIILILLLSFWAIKPLLLPGFFQTHDDTAPARIFEMAKALSFAQFPARWVPDLGYGFGYPLFNFYAPLPYYIGAVVNLTGFDAITSAKVMYAIGILLSGMLMYLFIRNIAGNIAGLTGAVLYLYAPYHAVNIYIRGAVGEYYAYAFIPLLFLGISKIISNKNIRNGILVSTLGFTGILLSHNILGLITGYFLGFGLLFYLFILFFKKQKLFTIYYLLFTIFLGFGLSSFFTIPANLEKKYTKVETLTQNGSDFHNHFVYPDQLWDSPWGYAGSAEGREDGMSFKIGKFHLILGLAGLISFLFYSRRSKFGYLPIAVFIVSLFFMLEMSRFLWEILPGFPYIQYPWRFLNFTLFTLSLMTSFIFILPRNSYRIMLGTGIIFITLWLNTKYFLPQQNLPLTDKDYTSDRNLRYKISKISDEYMPPDFIPISTEEETAKETFAKYYGVSIDKIIDTPTHKEYSVDAGSSTVFTANIAYFPSWQVQLDKNPIKSFSDQGRIKFQIPKGKARLTLTLKSTPVERAANAISVLSLFLLVYMSLFSRKFRIWQKNTQSK